MIGLTDEEISSVVLVSIHHIGSLNRTVNLRLHSIHVRLFQRKGTSPNPVEIKVAIHLAKAQVANISSSIKIKHWSNATSIISSTHHEETNSISHCVLSGSAVPFPTSSTPKLSPAQRNSHPDQTSLPAPVH
jgi:hypothetical protein